MGSTLSDPDFVTTRGPRNALLPSGVGPAIRYTMSADINEHFPTDGSPRTFYNICRVKAEDKWNFIKSILPDVYEDTANPKYGTSDQMRIAAYNILAAPTADYWSRNPLIRLNPQRHPIHQKSFASDAVVLRGNGFPAKSPSNELTFRTKTQQFQPPLLQPTVQPSEGYVDIGVTWRDVPYEVEINRVILETFISRSTSTPVNGEGAGSPPATSSDIANAEANKSDNSEIIRYCVFKPMPKGQNVQIPGGKAWFINDDGTVATDGDGTTGTPLAAPPEANVMYNPAIAFTITWKMVPRIPFAANAILGMVNNNNNIRIPVDILKDLPDVGTLRYFGYELSDPYYTCSGTKVYDITYSIVYRPGGNTTPNRGWNSSYCGRYRDIRRFVFGDNPTAGPPKLIKISPGTATTIVLPVTSDSQTDQSPRITTAQGCIAPFTDLQNLFRFEGTRQ